MSSLLTRAVIAPGVVLTIISLAFVGTGLAGRNPLFRSPVVNMSEAAALRDRATVASLIEHGDDPYEARPIAAGRFFRWAVTLTPLEAAIAANRPEVIDLLLWRMDGADPATRDHASCLARRVGDRDVIRVIESYRDGAAEPDCTGTVVPW